MGLDFTSIPDREGVALYIIHDGSSQEEQRWKEFVNRLQGMTQAQIVVMNSRDQDAQKIHEFYGLEDTEIPVLLAVRDDDQIAYKWGGMAVPPEEEIAHLLEEVGTT